MRPGGTVLFRISTWACSTEGGTITTTVTASKQASKKMPAIAQPTFTVGPCASTTSCDISPLPTGQPVIPEVEAQVVVPKSAADREKITFTATVTVDGASNLSASAQAIVIAANHRHHQPER